MVNILAIFKADNDITLGWYIQILETAEKCNDGEVGMAGSRGKEEGKERLNHLIILTQKRNSHQCFAANVYYDNTSLKGILSNKNNSVSLPLALSAHGSPQSNVFYSRKYNLDRNL